MISPVARFILEYWCKKYQKRDLAITSLGAKIRMRKICGAGSVSVGDLRPTTWNWFITILRESKRTAHGNQVNKRA